MRIFKEHNTDDGKIIETNQDVTDIIEKNKKEYKPDKIPTKFVSTIIQKGITYIL